MYGDSFNLRYLVCGVAASLNLGSSGEVIWLQGSSPGSEETRERQASAKLTNTTAAGISFYISLRSADANKPPLVSQL